jgi:hypothetical protein
MIDMGNNAEISYLRCVHLLSLSRGPQGGDLNLPEVRRFFILTAEIPTTSTGHHPQTFIDPPKDTDAGREEKANLREGIAD